MNDVENVKSKIDIVDFLSGYISLKKSGRNFKALCPFHSEKTPSFIVSPERQTWHCFGGCAIGGDVITFYEKWEGVDFLEALKSLAEKTGITLQKFTPSPDSQEKEKLYAINNLSAEFFHFILTKHSIGKRALGYLRERKIKKEIIENFLIGYAPESWDSLLKFLTKKGYSHNDIFASGLVVKSDRGKYYDRFRGRLMFTLKDQRDKIIGFSGRILPAHHSLGEGGQAGKEEGAKYINIPETPLYIKGNTLYGLTSAKESIRKAGFAIIVEGEFDFLASYQNGITNVVAIKGSALTENQSLLLKRYADTVHLALDSDFAGSEAAKRGIDIAENAGLTVKVISLLKGKDPAECIDIGIGFWKKSVEKAAPIYDFIISSAFRKYDPSDVNGKKRIADEVIPFLAKIVNPIILSHYIKKMSKDLGVTEESIESSIEIFIKKKKVKGVEESIKREKKERSQLLEEHLLSLVLQSENVKNALNQALKIVEIDDFLIISIKNIIKIMQKYLTENENFDIKKFSSNLTPEIIPNFDWAFLNDLGDLGNDPKERWVELEKTSKEIRKISLRREISKYSTKISHIDDDQNEIETKDLREKIKQLLMKLKELEA